MDTQLLRQRETLLREMNAAADAVAGAATPEARMVAANRVREIAASLARHMDEFEQRLLNVLFDALNASHPPSASLSAQAPTRKSS